ncbi:MAG: hypothetical protein AAFQ94_27395 [Bacteroidota bacterium]
MKFKFLLFVLFLCHSGLAQNIDSFDVSSDRNFSIIIGNPSRWIIDEFRVILSPLNGDRIGLMAGIIHPNDRLIRFWNNRNANMELRFAQEGFLMGAYVKPVKSVPIYLNFIYRESEADIVSSLDVENFGSSADFRDTYIEREITSYTYYADYRFRFETGKFIWDAYGGLGFKRRTVTTRYEDQSEFDFSAEPLRRDNGTFLTPTIHVGFNLGFNFKK